MAKHGKQLKVDVSSTLKLSGRIYDVTQLDSIAILLVDEPSLRGLYRLTFANGDAYVGQAINVINRYSAHRRRWDDIDQFEFFPIPKGALTPPERELIHLTEQDRSVRNIKDAHKPRGRAAIELEVEQGETVLLPWERDKRIKPGENAISRERKNFFELATNDVYPYIRLFAGWYIYNLIPDPFNTQKHLWVTTCRPSTNRSKDHQRLAVISTGSLETLVFGEAKLRDDPGQVFYDVFINTAIPDVPIEDLQSSEGYWEVSISDYPYGKVARWDFPLQNLPAILAGELEFPPMDVFLNSAYELNVRLMRQNAGGMFRKYHNTMLAHDFLAASLEYAEKTKSV